MERETCLVCGAIIKEDFTYCSYCGTLLNSENKFLEKEEILIQAEKGSLLDLSQDWENEDEDEDDLTEYANPLLASVVNRDRRGREELETALASTIAGYTRNGRREYLEMNRNGTVERLEIARSGTQSLMRSLIPKFPLLLAVGFLAVVVVFAFPFITEGFNSIMTLPVPPSTSDYMQDFTTLLVGFVPVLVGVIMFGAIAKMFKEMV